MPNCHQLPQPPLLAQKTPHLWPSSSCWTRLCYRGTSLCQLKQMTTASTGRSLGFCMGTTWLTNSLGFWYASFHYMLVMSSVLGTPFESYCPPTEHEHAFSASLTRDVLVGKGDRPTFKIMWTNTQHIRDTAPVADDDPVDTSPQNTAPVADDAPVDTSPQAKLMDKVEDVIDTVMGRHRLMIGQEMKEAILQYIRPCLREKCFLANHQYRQEPHRHLVFGGPAGTGKTSVAKAFAEILYELGLSESKDVVVIRRDTISSESINNMERRMRDAMKEDTGKVILVDETYQLGSKTSSSIIIMAGYLQQIEDQIFSLNEGFRGRFPDTVHFLPLTVQQLTDILEQKIKLSGYTISDYSREDMETAIGNIPIEVRSRHNARLVNQLIVKANTGQDETTLTRPNTLLTHADNVLLKRGAEGHLAVKIIDFGSACWEYYPCSFDVREEMSSHIAPEVMKGAP
ncbi:hypothetical protein Bbelb_334230 [Branchiostoma belcheri]|nr:hypothetical protein Bbelb_334230 [Branchiostoma belcheri]